MNKSRSAAGQAAIVLACSSEPRNLNLPRFGGHSLVTRRGNNNYGPLRRIIERGAQFTFLGERWSYKSCAQVQGAPAAIVSQMAGASSLGVAPGKWPFPEFASVKIGRTSMRQPGRIAGAAEPLFA